MNISFEEYNPSNNTTIELKLSNIVDDEVIAKISDRVGFFTNNPDTLRWSPPLVKEFAESLGVEYSLKAVKGWRKYEINFVYWAMNKLYKWIGKEKYIEMFNIEVPNE